MTYSDTGSELEYNKSNSKNFVRMTPHSHGFTKFTGTSHTSKLNCKCSKCRHKRSQSKKSFSEAHSQLYNQQPSYISSYNTTSRSKRQSYPEQSSKQKVFPMVHPRVRSSFIRSSGHSKKKPMPLGCEEFEDRRQSRHSTSKNVIVLYDCKQKKKKSKSRNSFLDWLRGSSTDRCTHDTDCSMTDGDHSHNRSKTVQRHKKSTDDDDGHDHCGSHKHRHNSCHLDSTDWSNATENYPSRYQNAACESERERKWRQKHQEYTNSIVEKRKAKNQATSEDDDEDCDCEPKPSPPKQKKSAPAVKQKKSKIVDDFPKCCRRPSDCGCAVMMSKPTRNKKIIQKQMMKEATVTTCKTNDGVPDYVLGHKAMTLKKSSSPTKTSKKKQCQIRKCHA